MTKIDNVSINDTNFKHLDTTKDIIITPKGEFSNSVQLNASHTWTAKVSDGTNYVGDYPVTLKSTDIVVNSAGFTKLPAGNYHLEVWEEWIDSNGKKQRSIYPSPQRTIDFNIYQNITDLAENEIKHIGFQDVVDQAVMNIGMNYVFKVNMIEPDQNATVVQAAADGKNYVTFNIPRGAKGDKGDKGVKGDPGTWTTWQTQLTSVQQTFDGANCEAPYNDLNTIPTNSRIIYGAGINHLANVPSELVTDKYEAIGMQVITDGFNGDQPGSLQTIHLANSGKTYQRMIWGDSGHWQEWHSYADGEAYLPGKMIGVKTGVPYDDLNTFPMNQTITIAETPETITQIKNLPPLNGAGGLTVRSFSWGTANIGGIQIAVDEKNVMYHRIAWGAENRWGAWRADRSDDTNSNDILPSLSLFQKVGVVGDSYASGELAFDSKNVDHYDISWLQIMARKNGFTGTNFSMGGMSTRTWLTNPKCMPLMQSSDAQDLYILALGINDEALGTSYIGSEADIDNGADTFYGNYGKIIKAIQTKAPQAKLVIATIADSSDIATKFNKAITTIANHFAIPVIVQLDDPLFNSSFYKDNMIGGHPTGPVYASMAEAFERLIGHSMIDHLDYYKTFKKDA